VQARTHVVSLFVLGDRRAVRFADVSKVHFLQALGLAIEAVERGEPGDLLHHLSRLQATSGGAKELRRSFSIVDHKVAEAEFFLGRLHECSFNVFQAHCYTRAFISSARSIAFALQAVMSKEDGFSDWYARHQATLRDDRLARFFHEFRTVNQHIGDNLVRGGQVKEGTIRHYFMPSRDLPEVPEVDLAEAAEAYFRTVLQIVFDCYVRFGPQIDQQQRFTADYFASIGKTIADAEEELGLPRGWTDVVPGAIEYRWQALRDHVADGCEINRIFEQYLGVSTPRPARLPAWAGKNCVCCSYS